LCVPGRTPVNVVTGRDYTDILSRAINHRPTSSCSAPIVKNPPAGPYCRVEIAIDFTASARQAAAFAFALLPDAKFCLVSCRVRHGRPATGRRT
jgi:hypothetical protein